MRSNREVRWSADVSLRCAECGMAFRFTGVQSVGAGRAEVTMSMEPLEES